MSEKKVKKIMPVWKIVLLTFAGVIGLAGVGAIAGLIMGGSDPVYPESGIYFLQDENFNSETEEFDVSSDFKLTVTADAKIDDNENEIPITANKITLSLKDAGRGIKSEGGYISNYVIKIPETAVLNKPFNVEVLTYDDLVFKGKIVRGGSCEITARSEYELIGTQTVKINIDVPVYEPNSERAFFSAYAYDSVAGETKPYSTNANGEIEVVEGANFKLGYNFYPLASRYLYSGREEKMMAYSFTGTNVSNEGFFDSKTLTYHAMAEGDLYTIKTYVFKTAAFQKDFLANFTSSSNIDTSFEGVNTAMIDYFAKTPNSFVMTSVNIRVVNVTVSDFRLNINNANMSTIENGVAGKSLLLSSNSSEISFDASLGVVIEDSYRAPLNSVYARNVGIAYLGNENSTNVYITGGGYVMKVTETVINLANNTKAYSYQVERQGYSLSYAKMGRYNFSSEENATGVVNTYYYVLPNTTETEKSECYTYNITSSTDGTMPFGAALFIQEGNGYSVFFKSEQNSINDLPKFNIKFNSHTDISVSWVDSEEGVTLKYDFDTNISTSIDLSKQVAVDLGNTYQVVRYFLYFGDGATVDNFSAITTKPPVAYTVGSDISYISGLTVGNIVYLYELSGTQLKAVGGYTGITSINLIACIVKSDAEGNILNSEGEKYVLGDKYQIQSQTDAKIITIDSTIPYSSFSGAVHIDSAIPNYFMNGQNGVFVPSELYVTNNERDSLNYRIYCEVFDDDTTKRNMQDELMQMIKDGELSIAFDAEGGAGGLLSLDKDTLTSGEEKSSAIPGYVKVYVEGKIIISSSFYSTDGVNYKGRLVYDNGNVVQDTQKLDYKYAGSEIDQDKGFYIYTQIADQDKTQLSFEALDAAVQVSASQKIVVSVNSTSGTVITWGGNSITNQSGNTPVDTLNSLIELNLRDQLGREIKTSVASYTINQSSYKIISTVNEGDVRSPYQYQIATYKNAGKTLIQSFSSTDGNVIETDFTYVVSYKAGELIPNATFNYKYVLTFSIVSEGITSVSYDKSNGINVDLETITENFDSIVVDKLIQAGGREANGSSSISNDSIVYLNNIYKVYTSSSDRDPLTNLMFTLDMSDFALAGNYEENLKALFSRKISEEGQPDEWSLAMLSLFKSDGLGSYTQVEYKDGQTIDAIALNIPFFAETTLTLIVTDPSNVVNLRFRLRFNKNVDVIDNLTLSMSDYVNYLATNDDFRYAVSVFGDTTINLDDYFRLQYLNDNSQINWANVSYIEGSNKISIAGNELQFDNVSKQEVETITFYFYSSIYTNYAFKKTVTFVINPNVIIVVDRDFISLKDLADGIQVRDYYQAYVATDYIKGTLRMVTNLAYVFSTSALVYTNSANPTITRGTASLTFNALDEWKEITVNVRSNNMPQDFVFKDKYGEIHTGKDQNFKIYIGYGALALDVIKYLFEVNADTDYALVETSEGETLLVLNLTANYALKENVKNVVDTQELASLQNTSAPYTLTFKGGTTRFIVSDVITFYVASQSNTYLDLINVSVNLSSVGVNFTKYAEYDSRRDIWINKNYSYDIATSSNPQDIITANYYQEITAGSIVPIVKVQVKDEEFTPLDFGLMYSKTSSDNSLDHTLSVYLIDSGYEGLIEIVNKTTIKINSLAAQNATDAVYAVLRLRLYRQVSGSITEYMIYYRIKINPNTTLDPVTYPYDHSAEYVKGQENSIELSTILTPSQADQEYIGVPRYKQLIALDGSVVDADAEYSYDAYLTDSMSTKINLDVYFENYTVVNNVLNLKLKDAYKDSSITFIVTKILKIDDVLVYNSRQTYIIYINYPVKYSSTVIYRMEELDKNEDGNYYNTMQINLSSYTYTIQVNEEIGNGSLTTPQTSLKAHILTDDTLRYVVKAGAVYTTQTELNTFLLYTLINGFDKVVLSNYLHFFITEIEIEEFEFFNDFMIKFTHEGIVYIVPTTNLLIFGDLMVAVSGDNSNVIVSDVNLKTINNDMIDGQNIVYNFEARTRLAKTILQGKYYTSARIDLATHTITSENNLTLDDPLILSAFNIVSADIICYRDTSTDPNTIKYFTRDYKNLDYLSFVLAGTSYFLTIYSPTTITQDEFYQVGIYNEKGNILVIDFEVNAGYKITYKEGNTSRIYTTGNTYDMDLFVDVEKENGDKLHEGISYTVVGKNAEYVRFDGSKMIVAYSDKDIDVTVKGIIELQYGSDEKYSFTFNVSFAAGFDSTITRNYPQNSISLKTVGAGQTLDLTTDKFGTAEDNLFGYLDNIFARQFCLFNYATNSMETQDVVDRYQIDTLSFEANNEHAREKNILAANVDVQKTINTPITLYYFFNGQKLFEFVLNYSYIVTPNVEVESYYPFLLDGAVERQMNQEYIDGLTPTYVGNFFNTVANYSASEYSRIAARNIGNASSFKVSISISNKTNVSLQQNGLLVTGNEICNTTINATDPNATYTKTIGSETVEFINLPVVNFTFELPDTSRIGSVTFIISINEVTTSYTVVVNNVNSLSVSEIYTNYNAGTEIIYIESYKSFDVETEKYKANTDTDMFMASRLVTYQIAREGNVGSTYYARFEKGSEYIIVPIKVDDNNKLNATSVDLGCPYADYVYAGSYSTISNAKTKTSPYSDLIYTIVPHITSRVSMSYMGYEVSNKVLTMVVTTDDTNFYTLQDVNIRYKAEQAESYKIYYVDTKNLKYRMIGSDIVQDANGKNLVDGTNLQATPYSYNIQVRFEFQSTMGELKYATLSAGTTYELFDGAHTFQFKNARTGEFYTAATAHEGGDISLALYGFTRNPINVGDEIYNRYVGRVEGINTVYDLKPNNEVELNQNYITTTAHYLVTYTDNTNSAFAYTLQAQGCKNAGNFVVVKLTYTAQFGGNDESKVVNLLVKVVDSYRIKFKTDSNSSVEADKDSTTMEISQDETITTNYNPDTSEGLTYNITVKNLQDDDASNPASDKHMVQYIHNVTKLYESAIVVYKHINDASNNYDALYTYNFTYTFEQQNIGEYNTYTKGLEWSNWHNQSGLMVQERQLTAQNFVFGVRSVPLGDKYYYFDAEDIWGYKFRFYFSIYSSINPKLINLSDRENITEGESFSIGAYYNEVTPNSARTSSKTYPYSFQASYAGSNEPKVLLYSKQFKEKGAKEGGVDLEYVELESDKIGYIYNENSYTWSALVAEGLTEGTLFKIGVSDVSKTYINTIITDHGGTALTTEEQAQMVRYKVIYNDIQIAPIAEVTPTVPQANDAAVINYGIEKLEPYMFKNSSNTALDNIGWASTLDQYKIQRISFVYNNQEAEITRDGYVTNTDGVFFEAADFDIKVDVKIKSSKTLNASDYFEIGSVKAKLEDLGGYDWYINEDCSGLAMTRLYYSKAMKVYYLKSGSDIKKVTVIFCPIVDDTLPTGTSFTLGDVYVTPQSPYISTSNEVSYYTTNGDIVVGEKPSERKLPFFSSTYYGNQDTINVTMVVRIQLSSGEFCDLRTNLKVSRTPKGTLEKVRYLDTETVSGGNFNGVVPDSNNPTADDALYIYNNTVEITTKANKTVRYAIATTSDPTELEYETTTLKSYNHREFVKIVDVKKSAFNPTGVYYLHIDGDLPERVIYSGVELTLVNNSYYEININKFLAPEGNNIVGAFINLNVEDEDEVSYQDYTARTIYSLVYVKESGYTYEQETVISLYPYFRSIEAAREAQTGLGYYNIDRYTKYTPNTMESKTYYVIQASEWGKTDNVAHRDYINSTPGSTSLSIGANPYMFTYRAVGASIDENGTVIAYSDGTSEGFSIENDGITVTVYMKVSGENGEFDSNSSGLELGTVAFRLTANTPIAPVSGNDNLFKDNTAVFATAGSIGNIGTYIVKKGDEFNFEEAMADSSILGLSNYVNAQIRILYEDTGSNVIVIKNLDKYVYNTVGGYTSTFVLSYKNGTSINYKLFTANVIVYDDTVTIDDTLYVNINDSTETSKTIKELMGIGSAANYDIVYVDCESDRVQAEIGDSIKNTTYASLIQNGTTQSGLLNIDMLVKTDGNYEKHRVKLVAYSGEETVNITMGIPENTTVYLSTAAEKLKEAAGKTADVVGYYTDIEGQITYRNYVNMRTSKDSVDYYLTFADGSLVKYNVDFRVYKSTESSVVSWWYADGDNNGTISKEEIFDILNLTDTSRKLYNIDTNFIGTLIDDNAHTISFGSFNERTEYFIVESGLTYIYRPITFRKYVGEVDFIKFMPGYTASYALSNLNVEIANKLSITQENVTFTYKNKDLYDITSIALDENAYQVALTAGKTYIELNAYARYSGVYYKIRVLFVLGRSDTTLNVNYILTNTETDIAEVFNPQIASVTSGATTITWYNDELVEVETFAQIILDRLPTSLYVKVDRFMYKVNINYTDLTILDTQAVAVTVDKKEVVSLGTFMSNVVSALSLADPVRYWLLDDEITWIIDLSDIETTIEKTYTVVVGAGAYRINMTITYTSGS